MVRQGDDLLLVATGSIAVEVVAAAERLAAEGVDCAVMVVACLNPPPVADLVEALSHFRRAVTVEVHYQVGGLGSLVAEIVADHGLSCRTVRLGVRNQVGGLVGSAGYMQEISGLNADGIVKAVAEITARRRR